MAAYITKTELQRTLGIKEPTLLSNLSDAEITLIITEMSDIIDNYLSRVADLPFSTTPELVKRLCKNLVKYEIWSRFANSDVPENITKDKDWTFKTLEKLQKGEISLGAEPDYTDDEDDLAEQGGLTDNLKWASRNKVFTEDL